MADDVRPVVGCFLSYAKRDEKAARDLWARLDDHLRGSRHYRFETWQFLDAILVGDDFHERILAALDGAHLGVFALSPRFLLSTYIREHELPPFVSQAGAASATVAGKWPVPVELGQIDDANAELYGLDTRQIYGKGKPYTALRGEHSKDTWVSELSSQIHRVVEHRLGMAPGGRR